MERPDHAPQIATVGMEDPVFGEWLSRQLELRGLGQREFAARVGMGHAAVRTWITGFSTPEWHTCRKIGDTLGVPREEVRMRAGYLDPEDEPPPPVSDDEVTELVALYRELGEADQEGLLRTARALRDYQRRRRPAGR